MQWGPRKGGFSWRVGETGQFSKGQITKIVRKALRAWKSIANLKFRRQRNSADTRISFQPTTHSADGESSTFGTGVLAHAYLVPQFVHLNGGGFSFSLGQSREVPLLEVVAHELGHNLGLDHSYGSDDLMQPNTRNKDYTSVTFSATDKQRIQAIHGPPVLNSASFAEILEWVPGKRKESTWRSGKWTVT